MAKRWVGVRESDQRAIELHLRLLELEKMPLIEVQFSDDRKSIFVGDKNNKRMYREFGVDGILRIDMQAAKKNGGTYRAVMDAVRPPGGRVPQVAVDEAVHEFLSGDQDAS